MWSPEASARCAGESVAAVDPIIHTEVSIRLRTIEELDGVLPEQYSECLSLPWEASFLAGKAFATYRGGCGAKVMALPDFCISGCTALLLGMEATEEPLLFFLVRVCGWPT